MSIPYFTISPVDLNFIGLGELPFFTITAVSGVAAILFVFDKLMNNADCVDKSITRPLIVMMMIGAYLGSFWGQILLYHPEMLRLDTLILLKIWQGGFSSIGGFVGYMLAGYIFLKIKKEPLIPYLDIAWIADSIGWTIARLGCTVIHDHPGIHTSFFLGIQYPDGVRHDLGFYEFLFSGLILVPTLIFLAKRKWTTGLISGTAFLMYGFARFFLDFLRENDPRYFYLTPAQYGMILFIIAGVLLIAHSQKENPKKHQPLL